MEVVLRILQIQRERGYFGARQRFTGSSIWRNPWLVSDSSRPQERFHVNPEVRATCGCYLPSMELRQLWKCGITVVGACFLFLLKLRRWIGHLMY